MTAPEREGREIAEVLPIGYVGMSINGADPIFVYRKCRRCGANATHYIIYRRKWWEKLIGKPGRGDPVCEQHRRPTPADHGG